MSIQTFYIFVTFSTIFKRIIDDTILMEVCIMKTPFAIKLRQLRKAKHMTQEELAEALHFTRPAVTKYETGDRLPTM